MEWSGINEQREAMTLIIHHLPTLGAKSKALLDSTRHEFTIPENVARDFLK